jgi:transposase
VLATYMGSRKGRRRRKPKKLTADKAYSAQSVRDWLRAQRIKPVIPHKDNEKARWDTQQPFDRRTYRQRAVIEQCVGWLKECRRIGTRFEKLAVHFHGMLQLAMIRRYLRILFSDRA